MEKQVLAFIGGSGLYDIDFIDEKKLLNVDSPWGKTSDQIIEGTINKKKNIFLIETWQGS